MGYVSWSQVEIAINRLHIGGPVCIKCPPSSQLNYDHSFDLLSFFLSTLLLSLTLPFKNYIFRLLAPWKYYTSFFPPTLVFLSEVHAHCAFVQLIGVRRKLSWDLHACVLSIPILLHRCKYSSYIYICIFLPLVDPSLYSTLWMFLVAVSLQSSWYSEMDAGIRSFDCICSIHAWVV